MSENRKTIDSYLAEISGAVGKNIRLNDQGICAFTYEHLTIVIEVPESVGSFFVYSSLISTNQFEDEVVLYKKALQLNYLQQETRGGCLSIDPVNDEVMFSYTDRIAEVNSTDFRNILENFIETSLNMHKEMDKIRAAGKTKSSTAQEELPPEFMGHMHHHHLMP